MLTIITLKYIAIVNKIDIHFKSSLCTHLKVSDREWLRIYERRKKIKFHFKKCRDL